jgi:beta-lactam-binding protein with PASTA domain
VAQSLGPIRVAIPDVTGQSEHAAELNLRRRGLDLASVAQVETPGIPADQVLSQSPPANATQVLAPKVSLLLSTAADPQAFVMPSFVGQPLGSANRTLMDSGFRLGNVTMAPSPAPSATTDQGVLPPVTLPVTPPAQTAPPAQPSPASIIVSQSPPAGQKVIVGSAVSFEVR